MAVVPQGEFNCGEIRLMVNCYNTLTDAVKMAGFFTNGVEDHGTWHRTCVCSKKREGGGYTGNSFWVARLASGWYLGAWGGWIYRMKDEVRMAELCISWLTRVPNETRPDFDKQLKDEFGLVAVSEKMFDKEAGISSERST
ncbi:MAG TPA: hypothetical protein VKX17_15755 [Planctomycetota bacterium]|nr:hypothetical protein [Planctomycetota bacterium]